MKEETVSLREILSKEVVTSVVDYNLSSINELLKSEHIDLRPGYQRRFRWSTANQSRLIESFLLNVPVPSVFLSEDELGHYFVIDGQQRLNAVKNFINGELKLEGLRVLENLNGCRFNDLSESVRNRLLLRGQLRAILILRQTDIDFALDVFERLNSGSVELNEQEIRNSRFTGPLNDLMTRLSEEVEFATLVGTYPERKRVKSAIYKRMGDVEFVLRFFTFHDSWNSFTGLMSKEMNTYMSGNRKKTEADLQETVNKFRQTVKTVEAAFGEIAFKSFNPKSKTWGKEPKSALYDAIILACQYFDFPMVGKRRARIQRKYGELFSDPAFKKATTEGINHSKAVVQRVEAIKSIIGEST